LCNRMIIKKNWLLIRTKSLLVCFKTRNNSSIYVYTSIHIVLMPPVTYIQTKIDKDLEGISKTYLILLQWNFMQEMCMMSIV